MFVTPHGARPLARGGAFVAGADDLNAIYYNPAGVAAPNLATGADGWSILVDGGVVLQNVTYTRNENGIQRPAVSADGGVLFGAPLLIPQIAFARRFNLSFGRLSAGFGLWIPYTGLPRFPSPSYGTEEDLRKVPEVAPQRYALIGLHDGNISRSTVLAVLNPVVALSLMNDRLQVGLGPQLMLVYFRSALTLSSCPQVMCRPEQVDYDTAVVAQAFALTPSFNLGATFKARDWLRLGAAFQFPFLVRSAKGTVDTRLPVNEFFNGATVVGRDASLALNLPPVLRLGVELRPLQNDKLRVELAYTYEAWSVQKDITFTPQNIAIQNVKGIGTYALGPIALQRQMSDTHTIHLGAEFDALRFLTARVGGLFETNGVPDSTVTVLTPDNLKGMLALGVAVPRLRFLSAEWRFDLSYGHIFQPDRTVAPADSKVYPANPIRPASQFPAEVGGIGGGLYQVSYDLIALGVSVIR